MSDSLRDSIYEAIASIRLIDPHTHINPHAPASSTLADLLGYHYYTELAHSAGMPKDQIEEEGLPPRELVQRLVSNLSPIENTAQYRWLVEICRVFFGFEGNRIDQSNWEELYDAAERQMQSAEWPQMVLDQSNVEAVFLTNDFDDELTGFDTDTYIPCLRTDDLVFHLAKLTTRQRLAACTGTELDGSLLSLRESLKQRFEHFVGSGARACAISLPPTFEPTQVSDGRAATALDEVLRKGVLADQSHQTALARRVFWTLAELCDEYGLPFDLMIGVNRGVYADGVYQGQDLYDSRVSLIQYRELFNAFPAVKFPVSVLASVTNQELISYAWIFPNVITNGHWWYSNTPSFIARDAAARLEAVPQTKQIAYYSDAYKLEFVWPKFDMYRRVLAGILADQFVKGCGWSEERAIELGRQVLRDNVDEIFPRPLQAGVTPRVDPQADTWADDDRRVDMPADPQSTWTDPSMAGTSAALAAGAIGMVEVNDTADLAPLIEPIELERGDAEQSDSADEEPDHGDDGFSTIVNLPESSPDDAAEEPPQDSEIDDDDPLTINEEPGTEETVRIDAPDAEELDAGLADDESNAWDTAELPATVDLNETVRSDEPATEQAADNDSDDAVSALELDPLPSPDEIQAVDVEDVELNDLAAESSAPSADAIGAEADPEPLNLEQMLGEDEPSETSDPDILLLRGEESFELGEESLKVQPDPLTGELTFPVASSNEPASEVDEKVDDWPDELVLADTVENIDKPDDDSRGLDETIAVNEGESPDQNEPPDEQNDSDDVLSL